MAWMSFRRPGCVGRERLARSAYPRVNPRGNLLLRRRQRVRPPSPARALQDQRPVSRRGRTGRAGRPALLRSSMTRLHSRLRRSSWPGRLARSWRGPGLPRPGRLPGGCGWRPGPWPRPAWQWPVPAGRSRRRRGPPRPGPGRRPADRAGDHAGGTGGLLVKPRPGQGLRDQGQCVRRPAGLGDVARGGVGVPGGLPGLLVVTGAGQGQRKLGQDPCLPDRAGDRAGDGRGLLVKPALASAHATWVRASACWPGLVMARLMASAFLQFPAAARACATQARASARRSARVMA
jgi:hypothetical protein